MAGDFGDNKKPTRLDPEPPSPDSNSTCDWFDDLRASGYAGPPGPYDVSAAVPLRSTADRKFGYKGGQSCDSCPDYYQIQIYCLPCKSSIEVIFEPDSSGISIVSFNKIK